MNLLQAILKTVSDLRESGKHEFKVSSMWVTDRIIVLDTEVNNVTAKKQAEELTKSLKFHYPDITMLTDIDEVGTVVSITY
jgi:hypothetical protein